MQHFSKLLKKEAAGFIRDTQTCRFIHTDLIDFHLTHTRKLFKSNKMLKMWDAPHKPHLTIRVLALCCVESKHLKRYTTHQQILFTIHHSLHSQNHKSHSIIIVILQFMKLCMWDIMSVSQSDWLQILNKPYTTRDQKISRTIKERIKRVNKQTWSKKIRLTGLNSQ